MIHQIVNLTIINVLVMVWKRKILYGVFVLCFCTTQGVAQSSFFSGGGAHMVSLGNAGTMFQGVSALYTNPAGLAFLDEMAVDVSYERRYNLNELSTVSVAGGKRFGKSAIGFSAIRYGYSAYHERKVALTYARMLWEGVSIGGSFNYLGFGIDQYGSATRFTFDFGVQYAVNKNLSLGGYVFGPESTSLTEEQDIPSRFSIGGRYKTSDKSFVYFDIHKTINRDPELRIGVDYAVIDRFSLRAGANLGLSRIHFGPRFKVSKNLYILGGYAFDWRLGHSTALSLTWDVNKAEKAK